jgi:putative transposase
MTAIRGGCRCPRTGHGLDDVEHATLEYVAWFNHRRLHGELGMVPPAEFEASYYHHATPARLAASQ